MSGIILPGGQDPNEVINLGALTQPKVDGFTVGDDQRVDFYSMQKMEPAEVHEFFLMMVVSMMGQQYARRPWCGECNPTSTPCEYVGCSGPEAPAEPAATTCQNDTDGDGDCFICANGGTSCQK